ncbi:MAG TPA: cation:proton antiporter [Thermoanaerobaculia bacterium]|nr:cation:proton antiporter [Thermoanaerobaculia bacterium]HQN08359.1 cation:proton antiporter [Thermoanaerobaculia bacterium]HQP88481.1 cation:proton antiporter [Thermoanaerobaculia bacterium]
MGESPFLRDLVIVLAASLPVLFVFQKLRVPTIVAFLFTGILIGPYALGLVGDPDQVRKIAELGVVLILFYVGLGFSLPRLKELGRTAVVSGALQMTLAVLATAGVLLLFGQDLRPAIFGGLLVAGSSTAVVLPVLSARDEIDAPFARQFLGTSLFQDLGVIPLILLLPALAGGAQAGEAPSLLSVLGRVGLAAASVAVLVVVARFVVPPLLDRLVRVAGRETFTAGVVVVILGMVAIAVEAGVSAAMGAFAAGIVVAESESMADVSATFAPFRDILTSLFFVSIGMLLDPGFVLSRPLLVLGVVVAVVLLKVVTAYPALRAARAVPRVAIRAAFSLATVGEFSFVLALAGLGYGLLQEGPQQLFVAVSVLTMLSAPLLVAAGARLVGLFPERLEEADTPNASVLRSGHVVVVGYGLNGSNVARALGEIGIPYVVLDAEADRVSRARAAGVEVLLADATSPTALEIAGIARARALVVTVPDPAASRKIVRMARSRNTGVKTIVRTRYIREVDELRRAGANEVIPEEFETSIEILARLLRSFHVPGNLVATQIRVLRDEAYRKLRDPQARPETGRRLSALMAAGTSDLVLVLPEMAASGRTLGELDLEADHVAVPALLRDGAPLAPPPRDLPIEPGDTLLLVGAHEDLVRATKKLEGAGPADPDA